MVTTTDAGDGVVGESAAGPDPRADTALGADSDSAPAASVPGLARAWSAVAFPVTRFAGMLVILWFTAWATLRTLPMNMGYPVTPAPFTGDWLLGGWMRYDGGWYINIAKGGYWYKPGEMSTVAFFPTYPNLVRWVQNLLPGADMELPAILVTALAGLGVAVLTYRWACGHVAEPVARTAVLLLLLFPYAWYLYGAVYADAIFLFFAVAAFVLLDRDRPVLAGLVAIAATAARPVGTGVILGLVAVTLERREIVVIPFFAQVRAVGWRAAWRQRRDRSWREPSGRRSTTVLQKSPVRVHLRRLRGRDLGVGLSTLGLLGWMIYLQTRFDDFLLFVHIESVPGWDQGQGPRVWFKGPWIMDLSRLPGNLRHLQGHRWDDTLYTLGITLQAALVVGALCLVPLVLRRLGWGYAVYVIGVLGIPLVGSKDWQGTGRYMLAGFPVFVVVALWLSEHHSTHLRRRWLTVSAGLLVFFTSAFARGFYLA